MISAKNIEFKYGSEFTLKVDSFQLKKGETVAITGVSGSGKSTFLKLISGELALQSGELEVLDQKLHEMRDSALRKFRLNNLGMIFQDSPLLDYLSVLDNIELPSKVAGQKSGNVQELAAACGIEHLLKRVPSRLSEGERQRAAICRSLISSPKLVLADEPTSSLDPQRGSVITDLLIENCRKQNSGLLMVTHDHSLLKKFDRAVDISDLGGGND